MTRPLACWEFGLTGRAACIRFPRLALTQVGSVAQLDCGPTRARQSFRCTMPARKFGLGDSVIVQGLQRRADLNGKRGIIIGEISLNGRLPVCCGDLYHRRREEVHLCTENIVRASRASSPAQSRDDLQYAVVTNSLKLLEALLRKRADWSSLIDARVDQRLLSIATQAGFVEVMQRLLAAKASRVLTDENGITPLAHARSRAGRVPMEFMLSVPTRARKGPAPSEFVTSVLPMPPPQPPLYERDTDAVPCERASGALPAPPAPAPEKEQQIASAAASGPTAPLANVLATTQLAVDDHADNCLTPRALASRRLPLMDLLDPLEFCMEGLFATTPPPRAVGPVAVPPAPAPVGEIHAACHAEPLSPPTYAPTPARPMRVVMHEEDKEQRVVAHYDY